MKIRTGFSLLYCTIHHNQTIQTCLFPVQVAGRVERNDAPYLATVSQQSRSLTPSEVTVKPVPTNKLLIFKIKIFFLIVKSNHYYERKELLGKIIARFMMKMMTIS